MNWSAMMIEKLSAVSSAPPRWRLFRKNDASESFSLARYHDVTPEMVAIVVAHRPPGDQYGQAVVNSQSGGMSISIYGAPDLAPDDAEVLS